ACGPGAECALLFHPTLAATFARCRSGGRQLRLFHQMDLSGRSKYLIDVENHYELAIASANRSHEFGPPACSNARYVGRYYFVELGDLVDLVGKDSNRCRLPFEIHSTHTFLAS